MAITGQMNDTPDPNHDSEDVSASEVPIHHIPDNESDSDFASDNDDNDRDYQLLTSEPTEGQIDGQNITYFPHNYNVEWIEWTEEAERALAESSANSEEPQTSVTTCEDRTQTSGDRQAISLSDDRINEIKVLMSGFSLPNESIPLWAKDLSEDQWKTFLDSRLEPKRAEDK